MKSKKMVCMLLAFTVIANCIIAQVNAAEVYNEPIWLEDMACELINPSNLEFWEECAILRASGSINGNISAYSMSTVFSPVFLQARNTVTINCSYSPSSASMDFGVIAPDGKFYYVNVKEGSINQPIRVNQTGDYSVAIRNNSSQTVSVVGFVEY